MIESIKQFPKRFLEWWNKFTVKQRFIIVGVVASVMTLLIIMIVVLNKPKYVELITCESTAQASEVTTLLSKEGLKFKVDDKALRIDILKSQISDARLVLGENGIPSSTYSLKDALSGGLSTTEADKKKKYAYFRQSDLEADLKNYSFVKNAWVTLNIPQDDGTLISTGAESSAAVCLDLKSEMSQEAAQGMARFIATALGNATTDNIVIMDTQGRTLFAGGEDNSGVGTANSQLSMKQQTENAFIDRVRSALIGTGEFGTISVAPNLDIDFSSTKITQHDFEAAPGQTQGVLTSEHRYESTSTSGIGGIPGTTSNDETNPSYVLNPDSSGTDEVVEYEKNYAPNERMTLQDIPAGLIKYASSSIAVTATRYVVVKEEDVRRQGLLDGISWAEYKTANSGRTKLAVDADMISVVSKATGIPEDNISFVSYSENLFVDKEKNGVKASDVMQVLLIVIILALLAFVVLRSMRGEKKAEQEEELSVESLLQSTPQEELEDIEVEQKSEVRKLIDKFVDDNPEAAANLLRNWLNEDWG